MNPVNSFCGILVLGLMSALVYGGHHELVDDEIWAHVFKVLSDTEHGKKIVVSHPEPAHLVDAYTKVDSYHHEPFAYRDHHHHDHHHHAPAPVAYHHGHHEPHHIHGHPSFHHGPPTHHHHHDDHHEHIHGPELGYRIPVPPVLRSYGPPLFHRDHRHHK